MSGYDESPGGRSQRGDQQPWQDQQWQQNGQQQWQDQQWQQSGQVAPHGQYGQLGPRHPQQPVVVVPAKTPGLAVLFSFLWLGAGNCYAGQTALGVVLVVAQVLCAPVAFFLVLFSYGFGAFLTLPIWLAAFAVSAVIGYQGCVEHNRRLGVRL